MNTPIEERLQHYLDRIAEGESVRVLLPEIEAQPDGAELASLVALSASAMEALPMPLSAPRRGRMQFELQTAFNEAYGKKEKRRGAIFGSWLRPIPRLAALVLALMLLGTTGVVVQAEDSVPGDALYGVKRVAESARMALTVGPLRRARLHLQLADRRFDELQRLADRGGAVDAGLIDELLAEHRAVLAETERLDDPILAKAARDALRTHQNGLQDWMPKIEDAGLRQKAEDGLIDLGEINKRLPTAIARPVEGGAGTGIGPIAASPEATNLPARDVRATATLVRSLATIRAMATPTGRPVVPTGAAGRVAPQPGPSVLPPGSTPLPPSAEPPGMVVEPGTPIVRPPPRHARETAEAGRRATEQLIIRKKTQRAVRKATERARDMRATEQAIRHATQEARRREAAEATREALATRQAHRATREAEATASPPRDRRPTSTPEIHDLTPEPSETEEPAPSATP
jgi:hypothetical protein